MPNAMLMGSWILMFVALALNMEILTFTPQYATFGSQFYMKPDNSSGEVVLVRTDCTIDVAGIGENVCVMSQVARFIQLINIQLPFFGVILFFANLVFLAAYFFTLVYVGLCRRQLDHKALKVCRSSHSHPHPHPHPHPAFPRNRSVLLFS